MEFRRMRWAAIERGGLLWSARWKSSSVAAYHIPASFKAAERGVDWQAFADIGDRLENTRDRVETRVLWTMSQVKLVPLRACAERHLGNPG